MQKTDLEFKPRGRVAHEGHKSKVGMSWDTEILPVFKSSIGDVTIPEFRSKFQKAPKDEQFSMYIGEPLTSRYGRKTCACGGKINLKGDGFAVCSLCDTIFNGGGNTDNLLITTYKYDDGRPDVVVMPSTKPPPIKGGWLPNSFWKAAKHGRPG